MPPSDFSGGGKRRCSRQFLFFLTETCREKKKERWVPAPGDSGLEVSADDRPPSQAWETAKKAADRRFPAAVSAADRRPDGGSSLRLARDDGTGGGDGDGGDRDAGVDDFFPSCSPNGRGFCSLSLVLRVFPASPRLPRMHESHWIQIPLLIQLFTVIFLVHSSRPINSTFSSLFTCLDLF